MHSDFRQPSDVIDKLLIVEDFSPLPGLKSASKRDDENEPPRPEVS